MHPVLFNIGPLTIYTYGLFLLIAFVCGTIIAQKKRDNIPKRHISNIVFVIFIFGIIGARIFCVLSDISYYTKYPLEILGRGGFIFHGGFIFSLIAVFLYCRYNSLSFLKIADIFSYSLPLGLAIGRIGCFFEGCCFGKPTDLPFGIIFPEGSFSTNKFGNIPIHPTQLYLSILNFILFLFLLKIKPKKEGDIFFLFLFFYSIIRFFIEFLRDQPPFLFSLTQPQVVFGIMFVISIIFLINGRNKKSI